MLKVAGIVLVFERIEKIHNTPFFLTHPRQVALREVAFPTNPPWCRKQIHETVLLLRPRLLASAASAASTHTLSEI